MIEPICLLAWALSLARRVGPDRKEGAVIAFVGGDLKRYRRPGANPQKTPAVFTGRGGDTMHQQQARCGG
jgi:hypothetical protein